MIQTNINAFGAFAMSGVGAHSKIEGIVFLPIMSMSMALPTFVSQNIGAGEYERAKKGAAVGTISSMILAELVGILYFIGAPYAIDVYKRQGWGTWVFQFPENNVIILWGTGRTERG